MRRHLLTLSALLALCATLVINSFAAARRSGLVPLPRWLKSAETQTLEGVFGGATPIHTYYISYPRKIAVIFEFNAVVICRTCSGPTNATVPRGRLIRVTYDRQPQSLSGGMQFCESRGKVPSRALCLRR
jgi:hypothetical protein